MPHGEAPTVAIKRFPIDAKLAFFRLEVSHDDGIDRLAGLVEILQQRLASVTSEINTTLRKDGGAFILAFLADKQPLSKGDMAAFCREAFREQDNEETE